MSRHTDASLNLPKTGRHGQSPGHACMKFLAIVTHPHIYNPPSPLATALAQVEAWLEAPGLVLLAETESYWPDLRATLVAGRVAGPQVHDARIAALCRLHGVEELWTSDRDFSRFPGLKTTNPLVS
jgi:predicted nucleic acid-binding protein